MSVITISRHGGAGGKTLGDMVSKKLGCSFVDEEIIRLVAEHAKVSPQWVESVEKEAGGVLLKFIDKLISKDYMDRFLGDGKGYIDEDIYVDALYKVITRIAQDGSCVILGRGGQYILQDFQDAYHVLLIADIKDRIKFLIDFHKLTSRQAHTVISRFDKRRVKLYRKFHKIDYDQPDHYHLVINTSLVDLKKASELVCALVSS